MMAAIRITGLAYDPWAHWERREPSPWMGQLADGRWVPLTQQRYQRADRGMSVREDVSPDAAIKRRDLEDQRGVEREARELVRREP